MAMADIVGFEQDGCRLTITVDALSPKDAPLSKSGKVRIMAYGVHQFFADGEKCRVQVTVMAPNTKPEKKQSK